MSDWRTKPRVGRSEFLKYMSEIQSKIEQGDTNKQIYEYLTTTYDLNLSLAQFNRYVRKYFHNILMTVRPSTVANTSDKQSKSIDTSAPKVMQENNITSEESRKIRNPSDLKKFRKQSINLEDLQDYKESE